MPLRSKACATTQKREKEVCGGPCYEIILTRKDTLIYGITGGF
jgi:hypothetical protein